MDRIDEMYAFVTEDETGEGLAAFRTLEGMMPMVGADMERVDSLRPIARKMAEECDATIKLVTFTTRTEVEVYGPGKVESQD